MKQKKLVSLLLAASLLLSAVGCRHEETPLPTTTVPTETTEATEPPEPLTVREMYWKMRNVLGMKYPSAYTMEVNMSYRLGNGAQALEGQIREREQVIFSSDPPQFDIAIERMDRVDGEESTSQLVYYYRSEGKNTAEMYIYYGEPLNKWVREEDTDYSYSMLYAYQRVLHPTDYPENMTLDLVTQMVGDREAYVLRYSSTIEDILGINLDEFDELGEEIREKTRFMRVEEALYIDIETYELLQTTLDLKSPWEELSQVLFLMMTGVLYVDEEHPLTVTSYTRVYSGLNYSQVEVPPIPEEAYKALDSVT